MLRQDQLAAIMSELETLDGRVVLGAVQSEVGSGHHLTHFPERKFFWDYCNKEAAAALQDFVISLHTFAYSVIAARKERGMQTSRWNGCNFCARCSTSASILTVLVIMMAIQLQ